MPSIRVLVVDDSVVVRRLVADVLSADPDIEVAATAANGVIALRRLETIPVDVITLDIEMPELDGLETLKKLRAARNRTPVIMFSTLTERGAQKTLEALAAGAQDYVTKPSNMGSVTESRESVQSQLIPRIKALAGRANSPRSTAPARPAPAPARPVPQGPARQPASANPRPASAGGLTPKAVVLGCSTGGPEALSKVMTSIPADFPLPILVVQHMPPVFTKMFAERLDRACALRVVEAAPDMPIRSGQVYIAAGDFHLEVSSRAHGAEMVTKLTSGPPENFCRPAVDVLFRSAVTAYGGALLGVVLTGMGSDGKLGAGMLRSAGARVIVQDRDSSVVWGMPGVIAEAGFADEILPIDEIAGAIIRLVKPGAGRSAPSSARPSPAPNAARTAPGAATRPLPTRPLTPAVTS